jgi:hypothetical protein
MKIESFRIQGFKNIKDVTVEGLSGINIFFGLNDVGKSNLFEALDLWFWLLSVAQSSQGEINSKRLKTRFKLPIFQLNGQDFIQIEVNLRLDRQDVLPNPIEGSPAARLQSHFNSLNRHQVYVTSQAEIRNSADKIGYSITTHWENGDDFDLQPRHLSSILPLLQVIHANRRLQVEHRAKRNGTTSVSYQNLKQAIFYAYLSSDLQQKERLNAIRRILSEPPFELGQLDVSLMPDTDEIDIGFVRSDGRLPIENLGSGVQQLLLILGQVFLNDHPIVALEEPEMNLSPQYQQYLMIALRRLMDDPAVALNQLFISTHSPYFEFSENFYHITLDQQGHSQVVHGTARERERYFAVTTLGPYTGARLNSLNQVELYKGVVEDLGLERGDLVIFVKSEETGHWEVRSAEDIAQELQALPNG